MTEHSLKGQTTPLMGLEELANRLCKALEDEGQYVASSIVRKEIEALALSEGGERT